jgi:hypothetical protein
MDDVQAALIAASNVTNDPDQVGALMVRYHQGVQAFRGQTGAPAPTPQQAQENVQNGVPGATVSRDLSKPEARWKDALIDNPDDWYNNVGDAKASSGGGRGPDFRFKDESMEVKGLWLFSQYGPADKWVFDFLAPRYPHLNLQFPGTGGTPAPAPAPAAPVTGPQGQPVPF